MDEARQKLVREFQEIKELELHAETFYTALSAQIVDRDDREVIDGIARDEQKHARMAEAIIKMLSE